MIDRQINPWENMKPGSQRRVEYETQYDYYWIYDFKMQFGFLIKFNLSTEIYTDILLRGIDIKIERSSNGIVEFYLALEIKEDWEIFHALCYDLIQVMDYHESDAVKASNLILRLEKWKNLLANKSRLKVSVESQMGVFSELYCLKNLIAPYIGYNAAIESWVGMDKDKQDFNLEKFVIEVKSHITTKGNIVYISSINQLYTEKDRFYLVSYGLTINENGKSIDDIYDELLADMTNNQKEALMVKIFESGWIPHYEKLKKEKFIVDSEIIYEVNDVFPKINLASIDSRIIAVQYKIDMSKCYEFKRNIKDLFGGE